MKQSRPLTEGEIDLARSVFGESIDYSRVRIIRGKWWPFQPRGIVMAPTGNVHFHPDDQRWSEDFSKTPLELQGLLIHELTHVWQSQTKGRFYLPMMRHPFCRYSYDLIPGRTFDRYGLEQQAEIVRHAFLDKHGIRLAAVPDQGLLPFA
ncbi:vgr related protein [Sphingomonas alba]|uniref:Vgr related protein n=1 Tax=Sphingomonas alba TaxID=2908208 RepID=A0ABT0RL25_9SPHN|nr:vgr related protein [Sphingomonas alba]MCL6682964.1 vgr related protein [Sphingomonas alba]